MSKYVYIENKAHTLSKYMESISPSVVEKGNQIIQQWAVQGYLPSSEALWEKMLQRNDRNVVATVALSKNELDVPHPVRLFDYYNLALSMAMMSDNYAASMFGMLADPKRYSVTDIEDVIVFIKRFHPEQGAPFAELLDNIGIASFFTQYIPLATILRKAPIFHMQESACEEAYQLDIAKGIDSTYLRAPCELSYFDLAKSDITVHDPESGLHELDGFYVSEVTETQRTLSVTALKSMKLDDSKPMRLMTLVFVGKPKDRVLNDTLYRIELYLQDGITIDDVINNTLKWYNGEFNDNTDDLKEYDVTSNLVDTSKVDVAHNMQLVRTAVNFLSYLNFAEFRRTETKVRSVAESIAKAKIPANQSKAMKKVHGKADVITIASNIREFSQSGYSNEGAARTKSRHFRRGHLRNQQYGSGDNVHHKPLYIAPQIVGGSKDGEAKPKTYKVK
ncbi:hypothetical protein [Vibrio sp. Hal054]|uniref:hypothetical protein n=1 Tax=Vibrio sp. Hal054 TaxID=3035158 RepID=UPI00301C364C